MKLFKYHSEALLLDAFVIKALRCSTPSRGTFAAATVRHSNVGGKDGAVVKAFVEVCRLLQTTAREPVETFQETRLAVHRRNRSRGTLFLQATISVVHSWRDARHELVHLRLRRHLKWTFSILTEQHTKSFEAQKQ